MKIFAHGDVLLRQVEALPKGGVEAKPGARGHVLAEGEVTGHAHIASGEVRLWNVAEQRYLVVESEGVLTHEEHGTIPLPVGVYEVIQQREYTPEAVRNVAD